MIAAWQLIAEATAAADILRRVRPWIATALCSLLACLGLAACGGDEDPATTATGATATTADAPCEVASAPEAKQVKLDPPPSKPSGDDLVAVVETTCGSFEITLDTQNDPKTTASFEYLANNGVFDGTAFHRIVPGFVIQGGDPSGDGTGGPGYTVVEKPAGDAQYTKGVVAMAKSPAEPPGASGSQFFVVTAADAGLPADYAIVGEVTSGLDVVQTIEGYGDPASGGDGIPLEPVLIKSVTIQ